MDHPLVGRIWDARAARWTNEAELREALSSVYFVMLGEKHDNPDHHRLQAEILGWLVAAGRHPVVAIEMAAEDQQALIDSAVTDSPRDPDPIGRALDWDARWPTWSAYRPIFATALTAQLRIVAANLPEDQVRTLARQGPGAIDAAVVARLGLDRPIRPEVRSDMIHELMEVHCGMLPEHVADRMVIAQVARDAQLTLRMIEAADADGAVLITGAGHVRNDRAVPERLRELKPDRTRASVAFMEVAAGVTEPAAYAERYGATELPFDYLWFTPVITDDDPCADFHPPTGR